MCVKISSFHIFQFFITIKVYTGWPKNLETWKNLEFNNLGKKT